MWKPGAFSGHVQYGYGMKLKLLIVAAFLFLSVPVFSQMGKRVKLTEFQFGAGPAFLFGDIGNLGMGGNLDFGVRRMLDAHFAVKANLNVGLLFGEDMTANGMKYYTFLIEPTGQIEYFFLQAGRGFGATKHMRYKPVIRPYVYAGGGPLFFFPSHYHEDAVELEHFSRYTLILVGGVGLRHRINAFWFWGFQVGGRFSTNDYLDGYSPKATTGDDAYIMSQFFLSHRF
jgi:hypothetical protein